ncbi:MAG: Ca-activated chloride channel family protein [Acidimicrobiales bacterium]|jgi:Ca-activated chloride channel family protein
MNAQKHTTTRDRSTWARPLSLLLALSLAASACSGSGDDTGSNDTGSNGDSGAASDAEESFSTTIASATEEQEAGGVDGDAASDALSDDAESAMVDEAADRAEEAVAESTSGGLDPQQDEDQASQAPDRGFFGEDVDAEEDNTFKDYGIRGFVDTDVDAVSTFALDVDTAAYSIGRQWLDEGVLPPEESVRVEEYVNSFQYDYPAPREGLTIVAEGGPSPFNSDNVIVQIGVQAEIVADRDRPDASLVFVIDTSGSMGRQDRLDLVKSSLTRLVGELGRDDTVAIITYSDGADVLLSPTSARFSDDIIEAIESLQPDGSTNIEAGLEAGYDMANEAFIRDGINRVILASDGVANVGLTDPDGLVGLIRRDADNGIQLVTVGVGMGNFNDVVMETLADDGDGFYAYVDTEEEADKLFSDDLVSTLLTVAIDGKIQVEFDDEVVESYRLIGFENRAVLDSDFRNDSVDAGELGAGHQVTAIYEVTLRDGVRSRDRIGTASLRWEDPEQGDVRETRLEMSMSIMEDRWGDTSDDFRLAVTVAAFAESLRGSPFATDVTLEQVAEEAESLARTDALVTMIRQADRLR